MVSGKKSKSRSRPTIGDVAREANVSIATVSRVINQTVPVAPGTVDQVQQAITRLNYWPQAAARVLAGKQTNTIGSLFTEISGDFISHLLRGIESTARENAYGLLIYSTKERVKTDYASPLLLGEHNTDGLLIYVDSVSDRELAHFKEIDFPVVLVHRSSPPTLDIPCVTIENKRGTRTIIDHLIEVHGCRRIGFLTGQKGHEDSYWRELGYRESLDSHGIPFDPDLIALGDFARAHAHQAIERWLTDGVEFDAVFAGDDEAAIGVYSALNNAQLRVPEDVAVVGFDDIYLSRFLSPPLTTVRIPIEQVGREAVKQLVNVINGEAVEAKILLPTELVIRQSCGCKPGISSF